MKRVIRSKVSGVSFKNRDGKSRQKIIKDVCRKGAKLYPVREEDNKYDENSIGLWIGGSQIGYVGSQLSAELADHMDGGGILKVKILQITGGGRGLYYGVNVKYTLIDPGPSLVWIAVESFGKLTRAVFMTAGKGFLACFSLMRRVPELVGVYHRLPEWAKPVAWGFAIAAPMVVITVIFFSMR